LPTSLIDVQARWAYSEISDGTQAQNYRGDDMDALRAKHDQGILFEQLTPRDRYTLAFQSACIRTNLFVYFIGIEFFELTQLSRFQLGRLYVPPNVWRDSKGQFVPFAEYVNTQTDEEGDARLVTEPLGGYRPPTDPLTIGFSYGHRLLIDGYHRAVLYWRFASGDVTLAAYDPQPPQGF
jgi:hypothetical protein